MKNRSFVFRITALVLAVIFMLSFTACGEEPVKDNTVDFHTEAQAKYLAGDPSLFTIYANGKKELSRPEPVVLAWEGTSFWVQVATDREFTKNLQTIDVQAESVSIYNLELDTTYYWKVLYSGGTESDVMEFKTSAVAPRNLYIDGVTNIRDIGGWKTDDGTAIKQGMLYRSAKFTKDKTGEALITGNGKIALAGGLGIVTELDLRTTEDHENGISFSILENGVKYVNCPMESGGNIILLNKERISELFRILADENNYPIVFHCSIGTDRTGMVAFLVEALMGVSEEDIIRDYLFSNFGDIGGVRTKSTIDSYISTVSSAEGSTLKEKTYNYLLGIGVSKADIDSVIRIMHK